MWVRRRQRHQAVALSTQGVKMQCARCTLLKRLGAAVAGRFALPAFAQAGDPNKPSKIIAPVQPGEALEPMPMAPEQFGQYLRDDSARWSRLAKARNIEITA